MSTQETNQAYSDIPAATSTSAAVASQGTVQLFNDEGAVLFVLEDQVSYWVDRGFRKTKFDIQGSLSELTSYMEAAMSAVNIFVEGVESDGSIDASDDGNKAAAEVAFTKVFDTWISLYADISRKYPNTQATGVKLVNLDGTETEVDPSQVDFHIEKGFKGA